MHCLFRLQCQPSDNGRCCLPSSRHPMFHREHQAIHSPTFPPLLADTQVSQVPPPFWWQSKMTKKKKEPAVGPGSWTYKEKTWEVPVLQQTGRMIIWRFFISQVLTWPPVISVAWWGFPSHYKLEKIKICNRLGGLSLPRKSIVRLTHHPDMTIVAYRGCKTITEQLTK